MEYYRLALYVTFGILPSLIWLLYYLGKDVHPEPKEAIVRVFLYGALATIPIFFIQMGFSALLQWLQLLGWFATFPILVDVVKWFFVIALTEEAGKYLVARFTVFKWYVLDEPLDVMLYMVVVALGFSALENILYLFSPIDTLSFGATLEATITISFVRFIGATFLHTLCSGLLGYFLVRSFLETKKRVLFTLTGISSAVLLHGLYDFSIITLEAPMNFIIPVIVIVGTTIMVIYQFDKIKKLKSICKV